MARRTLHGGSGWPKAWGAGGCSRARDAGRLWLRDVEEEDSLFTGVSGCGVSGSIRTPLLASLTWEDWREETASERIAASGRLARSEPEISGGTRPRAGCSGGPSKLLPSWMESVCLGRRPRHLLSACPDRPAPLPLPAPRPAGGGIEFCGSR